MGTVYRTEDTCTCSVLRTEDYSITSVSTPTVVSEESVTLTLAYVDVWLEGGSIYVSLGTRPEEYVEVEAKVIVGVGRDGVANVEILLDRDAVEKLRKVMQRLTTQ